MSNIIFVLSLFTTIFFNCQINCYILDSSQWIAPFNKSSKLRMLCVDNNEQCIMREGENPLVSLNNITLLDYYGANNGRELSVSDFLKLNTGFPNVIMRELISCENFKSHNLIPLRSRKLIFAC